jgi:ABC-type nitrate/sulfonate/bicarbonate transport system substrate-binding protein
MGLTCSNSAAAQEKKLETLNVAYTSATATRAPLWIASETGLFEKYGLDAKLIYIRAGSPSISALVSGDVQVSSDPASAVAIAAARGAPVVVIGTFGLASYRLVGHPSIASVQHLKGKSIGSVRPGSGDSFLNSDWFQEKTWRSFPRGSPNQTGDFSGCSRETSTLPWQAGTTSCRWKLKVKS